MNHGGTKRNAGPFRVRGGVVSERQLAANRQNAPKGGVKTAEGKAISRCNARKHGIWASALSREDKKELAEVFPSFIDALKPEGPLEETLVEKLALTYLRLQRCARAEKEYHHATWTADVGTARHGGPLNVASYFKPRHFRNIVEVIQRYDTTLTNQFLRLIHELERIQRRRDRENVPPPVVADITVSGNPD
ncbi:MAG: hypothetical protein J7M08_09395 [Planctomycetes bacterium]|nr:hypothetical protein [Planctomycetota bacterium]